MTHHNNKQVHVVGVPLDHGAGRRGVGMGPSSLRVAGLHKAIEHLGRSVVDLGDLSIPAPETQPSGEINAKFLPLVTKTCTELCSTVCAILDEEGFPLVLGGDHSIAIGTISGIAKHLEKKLGRPPKLGVIWFDAHGDINTPKTSPSGNIHGMPVACLLGNGPATLSDIGYPGPKLTPGMFSQIGLREIDNVEKALLRQSGIHCYTMTEIDKRSLHEVMLEALQFTEQADMLHVSFDIDGVDPQFAPGTGTQKIGGLTYREAHLAMEMVADTGRLTSLEMVEINPTLDDQNKTSELAVSLIASALGLSIL